jgi:ketosteroid isomerase-like protein
MPITKPEDAHRLFAEAFNAGDLDALVALYEPEAQLVSRHDQVRVGPDAIRNTLKEFLALRGKISLDTCYAFEAGDIALLRSRWNVVGTGPDGKLLEMQGNGIEVLRRRSDGTWQFIIDHPFGGE